MDDKTQHVVHRSSIRTRLSPAEKASGLDAVPLGGEEYLSSVDKPVQSFVRSSNDAKDVVPTDPALAGILLPEELIGRSFLLDQDKDGQ